MRRRNASEFLRLAEIGGRSTNEPYYLAIPIATARERYGVLLVSTRAQVANAETLGIVPQFALRAVAGLQHMHLGAVHTARKLA